MIETGLYQHFKGNIYRVIATATHTETNESVVVYHAVDNPDKIWVRPVSMWEEVVNGIPRFKLIQE